MPLAGGRAGVRGAKSEKRLIFAQDMNALTEKLPSVSVVMCTYNGERFLEEQMDSILSQDYPLLEVIVQDDGSSDDTVDILHRYARRDARVHVYRNERQLGINRNFHTALLRARGELVAVADQDDIWFPQKVRRQVECIGQAVLCYSDHYADERYELPLKRLVSPRASFEQQLFSSNVAGHTMLLRTDFVRSIKEWDYHTYYDWWLVLHAHLRSSIVHLHEALNWHRHYEGSATTHVYRRGFYEAVPHPTWQPYVFGVFHRLHLQNQPNWRRFYGYWARVIDARRFPLQHTIARLMLRRDPLALLHLCYLCLHHRYSIYPRPEESWRGRLRAFCYPLISAYGNDFFKL